MTRTEKLRTSIRDRFKVDQIDVERDGGGITVRLYRRGECVLNSWSGGWDVTDALRYVLSLDAEAAK